MLYMYDWEIFVSLQSNCEEFMTCVHKWREEQMFQCDDRILKSRIIDTQCTNISFGILECRLLGNAIKRKWSYFCSIYDAQFSTNVSSCHIGDGHYHALWSWNLFLIYDDVIKWKHFPCHWPFVRGMHRSPVNSPRKGQWRGALMFSLICTRINCWVNNGEAGDLRRHRDHYDVIVMI